MNNIKKIKHLSLLYIFCTVFFCGLAFAEDNNCTKLLSANGHLAKLSHDIIAKIDESERLALINHFRGNVTMETDLKATVRGLRSAYSALQISALRHKDPNDALAEALENTAREVAIFLKYNERRKLDRRSHMYAAGVALGHKYIAETLAQLHTDTQEHKN